MKKPLRHRIMVAVANILLLPLLVLVALGVAIFRPKDEPWMQAGPPPSRDDGTDTSWRPE